MLAEIMTLLVPVLLLALIALPNRFANAQVARLRQVIVGALVLQLVIAGLSFGSLIFGQLAAESASVIGTAASETTAQRIVDGLDHYDGVSGLMFLLVSFLGVVVTRFSIRYLDGDPQQGAYFRWLGFTLGAVSVLVLAGNLVLFFAAWVMTSFGLHHLLLHYKERPWARRAAWTKFAISRVGDVFLLAAMVLVYREFGSYHLADILAAAKQVTDPSWQLSLVGWFLVLGAVTKSAQFPVHFWLPETMEAPTPVSALMHAGIVNAGGYMLVRWSPLVVHAPAALATLAVIGGFTAVFAGLVMMTQANVKRSLGYSTIAQMGFMMLQCGLGAFSAAMLHIVAHSLYKAHAFLRTGDAWRVEGIPETTESSVSQTERAGWSTRWQQVELAFVTVVTGGVFALSAGLLGMEVGAKAGGIALGAIFSIALASWLVQAYRTSWQVVGKTSLVAVMLVAAYLLSFSIVNAVTGAYLPVATNFTALGIVGGVMVGSFAVLAILQTMLPDATRRRWLQVLYVHASNGFYIDTLVRRTFGLSLSRTPSST